MNDNNAHFMSTVYIWDNYSKIQLETLRVSDTLDDQHLGSDNLVKVLFKM